MTWRAKAAWWLLVLGVFATLIHAGLGMGLIGAAVYLWACDIEPRPRG